MRSRVLVFHFVAVTSFIEVCGCGHSDSGSAQGASNGTVQAGVPARAAAGARSGSAVKTASWPAAACDWIPKAEVEAILGPLAGPAKGREHTCRYPLSMDAATASRREAYRKLVGPRAPIVRSGELDSVAVVLSVELLGDVTDERAGKIAEDMVGSMLAGALGKNGNDNAPPDSAHRTDKQAPPAGWDVANAPTGTSDFSGRVGHLNISVQENTIFTAIPAAKKLALAAFARDRVPDLPISVRRIDNEPVPPPTGPDPCALLTRDEAESVLGKLVVPPYRSDDGEPFVADNGTSCTYYTAGHRVLVIVPHWTDGKSDFKLTRGTGRVLRSLAPDQAAQAVDTLDVSGPWDDMTLGLDGRLAFVKGDQMLEIAFATSSTDQTGALKLARIALQRLAAAKK
jgi:hypothetical protein